MRLPSALLAALVCVALLVQRGVAADPSEGHDALTAEKLAALAEQRSLDAIKTAYVLTKHLEGQPEAIARLKIASGFIPKIEQRVLIDLKSDRFLKDRHVTRNKPGKPIQTVFAWDLQTYMQYSPGRDEGRIDSRPDKQYGDVADKNDPFLSACLLSPPEPDGKGIDDWSLVSWLRGGEVHKELDEIDGRRCCVVDRKRVNGTLLARAWLDVERSLAPVKFQRFEFDRPEVMMECHATDFVELAGNGRTIWLPMRVDETIHHDGGVVLKKSTSVDRNATRINPKLSDESFRIEFPDGTMVDDEITKTRYVIKGAGE